MELNVKQGFKAIFISALLVSLLATFFALNIWRDTSIEGQLKTRVHAVLSPLIDKNSYKIEATIAQNKQTIAILIDEKLNLSPRESDDIMQLLRAAIGYDAARGDMIRMIAMPLKQTFFTMDRLLIAFEILALLLILALALWFFRKKPEVTPPIIKQSAPPTLSDQVLQDPAKAASLVRAWMAA
jgi:flagellar biosynthesis/type III secretory pathway M-ring protein FliF/YscJ